MDQGEIVITEDLLKRVAYEANLDQLALVLFHECRHQPESGKGIERIRQALTLAAYSASQEVLRSVEGVLACRVPAGSGLSVANAAKQACLKAARRACEKFPKP